jgi:hypothetical protein
MRPAHALLLLALVAGCHGPGHVEFTGGQCVIDGRPATLPEVEARQARISERILARQPMFVLITVLIVVLAGFSHIEKLLLLLSTRHTQVHGLAERLRLALERYRAHPLRYFALVVGTMALLGVAGGCYVYLDADKRASERALGLLQFCHLALRNGESQSILAEQRRNLQAIESTAGNIQTLVDKLPPAEQRKAKEIVAQINQALAQQGKLVSDYAARTDESAKAVRVETENLQKGLTSLGAQVLGLKALPASLHDVGEQVRVLDGRVGVGFGAVDGKLASVDGKLASVDGKLDALAHAVEALRAAKSAGEAIAVATPSPSREPGAAPKAATAPSRDAPKATATPAPEPKPGGRP